MLVLSLVCICLLIGWGDIDFVGFDDGVEYVMGWDGLG